VLVRRYPALVDGAFVIVAWVGLKLLLEFLRVHRLIHFEVNKWWSFGLIGVIFLISYAYARRLGPADTSEGDEATDLLTERNVEDDR
jgi:predicted tellurium resistance membrane protein TerC